MRYRIYTDSVGREGTEIYTPSRDLGTIEAPDRMRALDAVAERIGETHIPRTDGITVLGLGTIRVQELA